MSCSYRHGMSFLCPWTTFGFYVSINRNGDWASIFWDLFREGPKLLESGAEGKSSWKRSSINDWKMIIIRKMLGLPFIPAFFGGTRFGTSSTMLLCWPRHEKSDVWDTRRCDVRQGFGYLQGWNSTVISYRIQSRSNQSISMQPFFALSWIRKVSAQEMIIFCQAQPSSLPSQLKLSFSFISHHRERLQGSMAVSCQSQYILSYSSPSFQPQLAEWVVSSQLVSG